MALRRLHTLAKATDVTKLLLLNKGQVNAYPHMWSMVLPAPNHNPNPNRNPNIT